MFDEDPGSVKEGEAHWVMGYMRQWRPTFIYVSGFILTHNSQPTDLAIEGVHAST